MGFDHTKLIVGKKYPTRNGGSFRYIGALHRPAGDYHLIFAQESDGRECIATTTLSGRFVSDSKQSDCDIISDEPIREPVEVKLWRRFMNVYVDGTGGGTHESIEAADRVAMGNRIGVYELPETILVQPK